MGALPDDFYDKLEAMTPEDRKILLSRRTPHELVSISEGAKEWRSRKDAMAQISSMESAAKGVAQGATLGWAPELMAAPEALGRKIGEWFYDIPGQPTLGDRYTQLRDDNQKDFDLAYEANPPAYTTGEIGAGAASMLIPGGAAVKAVGTAGKLAKAGKAALGLARTGAIAGLGYSDANIVSGEPEELEKAGWDAVKGAGYNLVGGIGGVGLVKGIGAIRRGGKKLVKSGVDQLSEFAERRAFKSGNPDLRDYVLEDMQGAREIGRELLDSKALRAGDTPIQTAERLAVIRIQAGQEVEAATKALDDIAKSQGKSLSTDEMADYLEREILSKYTDKPAFTEEAAALRSEIQKIREFGIESKAKEIGAVRDSAGNISQTRQTVPQKNREVNFTLAEQNLKQPYAKKAFQDTIAKSPHAQAKQQLAGALGSKIEQEALKTDPEAYKRFVLAKERYSKLAPAERIAEKGAIKFERNRYFALQDMLTAQAALSTALATSNPLAAVGVWATTKGLSKLARERGAATVAVAADNIAKGLQKTGELRAVSLMLVEAPEKLGKYAKELIEAASRSEEEFLQMHAVFAKDIDYRKKLRRYESRMKQEN